MQQAKKFLFESDFDATSPNGGKGGLAPTFTEEDLATARHQGHEEGKAIGRKEAEASAESLAANALQTIERHLAGLSAAQSEASASNARDAAELAMAVTRKILPEISRRGALTEIEAMVCKCLADRFDEPRVVVRVHDSLLDSLRTRIDAAAAKAGFTGKLALLAEESLQVTDCRIEWADGGAERDEAGLWQEIEEAARRFIEQLGESGEGATPAQPAPAQPAQTQPAQTQPGPPPEAATITESEAQAASLESEAQEDIQEGESPGESHER